MAKILSLFDGSGGFPLAASLCGIEPAYAAEVEPYPIAVTKSRFPQMIHLGDVSKVHGGDIEPCDVVTFGSPCQDLSVAGKRAGLKHEANGDDETTRSGLFYEAIRIIKEMRESSGGIYPAVAVFENVVGVFNSQKGEDFRVVLEELVKIVEPTATVPEVPKGGWAYADYWCGDGWSLAYRVLDAQYIRTAQRRRRIYAVLHLTGECAGKVLFERESLRGYPPTSREAWQGVARSIENCAGADSSGEVAGTPDASYYKGCGERQGIEREYVVEQTTFRKGTRPHSKDEAQKWETADTANTLNTFDQGEVRANELVVEKRIYESRPMDSRIKEIYDGVSPTVSVKWHKGAADTPLEVSPTLPAQLGKGGNNPPYVVETIPIHDQATRFSGKRGNKSDGKGNGLGVGSPGDPMNTLTSGDRHAVAVQTYQEVTGPLMANSHPGSYTGQDAFNDMLVAGPEALIAVDHAFFNQGQNALYDPQYYEDGTVPTLVARGAVVVANGTAPGHHNGVVISYSESGDIAYGVDCRNATEYEESNGALQASCCHNHNSNNVVRVRYIVRRLTPTECARLQGFPDNWGHPDKKDGLSDEEYKFWLEVRNTHARINGKTEKEYSREQMLAWYNKLHTDSSEYKMWGNGIALPCAQYVMEGIAEVLYGKE